jgi:hypothetical protein
MQFERFDISQIAAVMAFVLSAAVILSIMVAGNLD